MKLRTISTFMALLSWAVFVTDSVLYASTDQSAYPVFLPTDSADWTENENWSSATYPNGAGAGARIQSAVGDDRNVNLEQPVTIGNLIIDNQSSPYRNRLRDRFLGNTLTFDGNGQPAILLILGSGSGYVEIRNLAGTILSTDLQIKVESLSGDPEFGALRLREDWSGPGGLIKTGIGMASVTGGGKDFTGMVVVKFGVLALANHSTPEQASSVSVESGGQLRLISASCGINPVRLYGFGGPLSLSGSGRSGLNQGAGFGVLGALRYDPDSVGNLAEVSSAVILPSDAGIHVTDANTLLLSGSLSGSGKLLKSGGGTLVLGPGTSSFSGPMVVQGGRLKWDAIDLSENSSLLTVQEKTSLGGVGQWGGTLLLETGTSLFFDWSSGLPDGPSLETSVLEMNAPITVEVRLPEGLSGPHRIPLVGYQSLASGASVDDITVMGAESYTIVQVREVSGQLELILADSPLEQWYMQNFDSDDLVDSQVSAPLANPMGDGVSNLLKYALGLSPFERVTEDQLRHGLTQEGNLYIRFHRDPTKTDIIYLVETSTDLVDWSEVLFDSSELPLVTNVDGDLHVVSVEIDGETRRFIRLRIEESMANSEGRRNRYSVIGTR